MIFVVELNNCPPQIPRFLVSSRGNLSILVKIRPQINSSKFHSITNDYLHIPQSQFIICKKNFKRFLYVKRGGTGNEILSNKKYFLIGFL